MLTGALHKWIGKNDIHDHLSLYSFSWLQDAKKVKDGLDFPYGSSYFISAHDSLLIKMIIQGIQQDPEIGKGLFVKEIIIQEDPVFNDRERFLLASPVFIKRNIDGRDVHFIYSEEKSSQYLTETLTNKLKNAGLSSKGVSVSFDKTYHSPKTKVIYYNKIGSKVSICPVKVSGTPEQIAFAWNVGIGNSTGIGFGAIK
ncbi:MAG: CRISPR-associated endoribonuclease Cas6 [Candidatus Cyclobacteriaceae bacterium M3_2C_046]